MDFINSVGGVSSSQTKKIERVESRAQASTAARLAETRLADDVSKLSAAVRLQAGSTPLREVSENLAQVSSQARVAGEGIRKIERKLQSLQAAATEGAEKDTSESRRAELAQQLKSAVLEIETLARDTRFEGKALLDGSLSGENKLSLDRIVGGNSSQSGDITLSIDDLSPRALVKDVAPDVSTPEASQRTADAAAGAKTSVEKLAKDVDAFRQSAEIVSAYIDSASENFRASQSVLQDADFERGTLADSIRGNIPQAIAAQTGGLSPDLIRLVN